METATLYYVLRPGATREEQWTWEEIEDLCHSGDLTGDARVFLPDEDRWARLSETRLGEIVGGVAAGTDAPANEERERLEQEYEDAVGRIASEDDDVLQAMIDAGCVADELGRRDEAREHFQSALHRFPYTARAAQEVRRRFSPAEQRTFRYLERPEPAWEDVGAVVAMPLARGPLYVAVPAAAFFALSWIPGGAIVAAALAFLWAFQVMAYTARGPSRPPDWDRSFHDPVRKLVRPLALMALVVAEWGVLALGIGAIAMHGVHGTALWTTLTASPVFVVLASIAAVLYLPAAMVSIGGFAGPVTNTLDPRRVVRAIVRMEHEYVYSVVLLVAVVGPVAVMNTVLAGVPVVSNAVAALLVAYAAPMVGLVLGRLLGRTAHLIA